MPATMQSKPLVMGTTVTFKSAPTWYKKLFAPNELITGTFMNLDRGSAIIVLNRIKGRCACFCSGEQFDDTGEFQLNKVIDF